MNWKKYLKQSSAALVAGTFIFSSVSASANELDSVSLNDVEEQDQVGEAVEAGLTQENFFYFLDGFFENVNLLLTFDDKTKAEKYAKFASERLAEAKVLFEEGKEEEAVETLEKALVLMTDSEDTVNEEDEEATEEEATEDETTEEDEVANEDGEEDATEDEEVTEDEEATEEDEDEDVLEGITRNNIAALTAALEHVKNPNARAALERNIEKTYAKILKKIEKQKEEEVTEEDENTDEEVTEDEESTEDEEATVEEEATEDEESTEEDEATEEDEEEADADKKDGFVPPGLAKKKDGFVPPGHAKKEADKKEHQGKGNKGKRN